MRWGELYYKRLWCNAIEEYKCDVVYNNLLVAMPLAFMVAKLIIFKKFLLQYKILPLNLSFGSRHKPSQNVESSSAPSFKIENLTKLPSKDELSLLSLDENKLDFCGIQCIIFNTLIWNIQTI